MGLNTQGAVAENIDIGFFQNGETSITNIGISPTHIEFWGVEHGNLNSEQGFTGSMAYSVGYATPDTQYVAGHGDHSDGVNAHYQYAGTGDCVYVIQTSNAGASRNGALIANVASFDADGFTMNYTEDAAGSVFVAYRAFEG